MTAPKRRARRGGRGVKVWELESDTEVTTFDLEEFRPLGLSFFALADDGGVVAFGRAGTEEEGTVVDRGGHLPRGPMVRVPRPWFAGPCVGRDATRW